MSALLACGCRVSLDDRLAALVGHLGASWLGSWRCLLLGDPPSQPQASQAGQAAAQRLLDLLEAAGQPASHQQAAVVRHAAALLAQQGSSMPERELRVAAQQLCQATGLACSQGEQQELASLLAVAAAMPVSSASSAAGDDVEMPDAAAPAKASMPGRAGKSVKFADDFGSQPAEEEEQQQQQQQEEEAAAGAKAGKERRPAAARGRKAAAAAADAEAPAAEGGEASPIATLAAAGSSSMMAEEPPQTVAQGGGLCQVFDSLSLAEEEAPPSTAVKAPRTGAAAAAGAASAAAGTATARSGKHRSRLRMMQAGTPGPATARKPLARTGAAGVAATAPRAARELPLTVAKTAPPPAARPSSSSDAAAGAAAGPVLLVLDGGLQALPWESATGLLQQR